jgi:hypothetical protein
MPIFHGPPTVVETIFDNNIFDTLPPPPNPRIEPGEVQFHGIDGQVAFHETDGSVFAGR